MLQGVGAQLAQQHVALVLAMGRAAGGGRRASRATCLGTRLGAGARPLPQAAAVAVAAKSQLGGMQPRAADDQPAARCVTLPCRRPAPPAGVCACHRW